MTQKYDLIAVGDSTIDTFTRIHDASIECDIDNKNCRICLNYGGKIPVDRIYHRVAGNAANVASGCAALGLSCAIYTHIGGDLQGKLIKDALVERGIASDYIVVDSESDSNLSVVISYKQERTILVYHQPWPYHLPTLSHAKWLYFTSVAQSFTQSNIVDEICNYAGSSGAKLAFSPGTYQMKAGIKNYPGLLETCDLLILNREEAQMALELEPSEKTNIRDILSKLLLLGPKIVVVTDSGEGSYATDGQQYLRAGVFPATVVEKTGAGDAYSSAFLSALIFGESLAEAMIWGAINGAHVIGEIGPNGFLNRDQIVRHRKAVSEMVATNL